MQSKTIVIIGVLDTYGSTNIPMAKSLIRLGFNVIPINYRTVIKEHGMQFFVDLVLSVVTSMQPYMVLICKGNGIPYQLINELNKYTITFLFNMDARPTIEKCNDVVKNAASCHLSSCTAYEMVEWFNKEGANCHYIAQGIDPEVFKPVAPDPKYRKDITGPVISMIGTRTIERDEYYKALTDGGFFPAYYGKGYGKEVFDKDFAVICSSSDFMISLNTHNGVHKGYFSNRLPRYLACGTCTLHLDPLEDLNKYFKDEKEIIFSKSKEELVEKLLSIDEETKIKIAINGRERVLKEYTWDLKMVEILNLVTGYQQGYQAK